MAKDVDEVYYDRNILACAFIADCDSDIETGWTPADHLENDDEWVIVWAALNTGVVSWHAPADLATTLLDRNDNYEYDGHTRADKNERLIEYIHGL